MRKIIGIATLALIAGTALAGGDHVGGHGHSGQRDASPKGVPGDAAKVSRTIAITMDDMRFSPAGLSVTAGETLRLKVNNVGKVDHELVIGSMAELKEHAELMRKFPGMEHDEPNMLRLAPGASGEIVWQFTKAGTVDFACLIPGHMEAGMVGKVSVRKP